MGHYASEMMTESPEEKKRRLRTHRIAVQIKKVPLTEFTVSELHLLLNFLGYRKDGPFLAQHEVEDLLEKKLKKIKKKK
jgi:hypothetical protein